jgi:Mg/Co/Ni transporter MgtE
LALKAADTSAGAVLRRLSRGWLAGNPDQLRYDWKYIEFLRGDPLSVKSKGNYQMRIGLLPPGQIAGLSHSLPYLHAAELLTLLPDHIAADTLELLPIERQIQVFGVLEEKQAERILARMAPNAAADLLGRQTPQVMKNYLERLPQEQTERLIELLRYPEDTVGGIMTNDFVSIPLDITVREAREMLHERLKFPDFTYFIYVIDSDDTRILRGVTTLREIMTAEADQQLEDIVNTHVSTLNPLESAVAAAYRVLDTHTAALPVTGGEGQLLGIVTVDAAVDQAAPQGWRAQAPKVFS